ncbi:hypothetical protein MATL_G00253790 [Megalops atlanticus]|uniref:Desmoplakin n=1 Tax=Megalops atlanticus TaxID=7932 RepID=A0A9D3SW68_MEGAT|nr:hypothetical protein MATL_G00253790 [Megalops atlanticus]
MSLSGSQKVPLMSRRAGSRPDLSSASFSYSRSEMHGGGNVFPQEQMLPMDGSSTFFYRKSTIGRGHGGPSLQSIHQNVHFLQSQINDHLNKAEMLFQSGGAAEADKCLGMASVKLDQLRDIAMDLHQMGQPSDSIMRSADQLQERVDSARFFQQRSSRGGSGGVTWEDPGRNFHEALAWIGQQKRLIETSPWGEDPATIEQQIISHNKFHSSIQRSIEVDRARAELEQKGDRALGKALEQEWDSLQKMSFNRTNQLRDLLKIIEEISKEIMWVNEREEEELVFDWGDKNVDTYIPRKQESYSKLMRDLEEKEKHLNKLNQKIDNLLKNNHPASDKIEAYKDTLQTQWSWLLQITKCIDVHLKENAAYSQFFKEANETYSKLQKEHEVIRKKFTCDKGTPLENLVELIKNLEREKEVILESKRQVQHLVSKAKSIVRLRPRNPEEKSTSPVIVKALCDFKQDQKQICKGNEAILKDNSQRSKWHVTGPGGLDMMIPSVCLQVPPPNPLSINLANKNEQYYEAIMGIWNQLYINIKSLISWQYCIRDINHINSLTISVLAKMKPEEYRRIIKSLETHYQEFQRNCLGSEMFVDEDKRKVEAQYSGAQTHYDKLIIQLPSYIAQTTKVEPVKAPEVKVDIVQPVKAAPPQTSSQTSSQSLTLLSELHALRQRLEQAESGLTRYLHLPLGENSIQECTQNLVLLEVIHQDIDAIRDEYLRLRERILRQLEGMTDADKAKFLRSELTLINQKLGSLEGSASIYLQRLRALQALMQSLLQAEDIIKVHEARLTEKETSSLDLREVEDYRATLKQMKTELDQKRDVLKKMESELGNAVRLNDKLDQSLHKCDVDLSRYAELVNQMTDRWRRIQTQIDSRTWDLEKQLQQLKHYKQTSSLLSNWIEDARQRQGALQAGKFSDIKVLTEHINQQKMLHSEIKGKKDKVEDVQRDADTCAASIKDYELQLASYSAGLETLLNIPIKRTMLQSPATVIRQEAADLQSEYIELLTRSGDYYKFLGEMLKNMEELKIRNTKIDVLEEELRRLKEEALERSQRNRSLEDTMAQYKLELSQSRQQLLSMEEVKQTQAMQVSAAKENLDSTYGQVKDLNDQVLRLTYQIEEEKRKRRLAEERYTSQRDEYESVVRKRQKELDELSRSKLDIEMMIKDKEREVERLRMQLEDEVTRRQASEAELSKVRNQCNQEISNIKKTYESEIHVTKTSITKLAQQKDEDAANLRMEYERLVGEKRDLEEELRRLRLSISQAEELRKKAEQEAHQQRSTGTEESRRRRELEIQIHTITKQRAEDDLRHKEALAEATKAIQDKNREITLLTQNLAEESRRRKTLEAENGSLRQAQGDLQAKNASSVEVISRLKVTEQEIGLVRVELERQTSEREKAEQSAIRLQGRIKDLQRLVDELEAEVEKQKKAVLDEIARRKMVEAELERTSQTCMEYTTTITMLRKQQDEASTAGRRSEQELRSLQEALDKSLRDHKATTEKLNQLTAELKALQQQLLQEQARVKEANLRNETLYKTIEEKSRVLNDNATEIEKLQSLTQKLTKERLRLEEELRAIKQERDELKKNKDSTDSQAISQISTLQLQLQTANKRALEHQAHINELSKEREKLKMEIEKILKEGAETSGMLHQSQTHYNELLQEKDSLLLRIKMMEQDKSRMQKSEDELARIKVSLESELRQKQRLQDEAEKIRRELNLLKSQYELKEGLLRQQDSDRDKAERERNSLRSEIERLTSELRSVEERYKTRLLSCEREVSDLTSTREALERELLKLRQRPDTFHRQTQTDEGGDVVDSALLVFDGVRRKVSAHQLCDCGIIDKATLSRLLKGQKTVEEVAVDIQLNLKGTGVIAGVASGPQGKMPITEAKNKNLLSPESAIMLLEAQAATGHIIDPKFNDRMSVDAACSRGLVDTQDRDMLMTAEAASTGFKDPHTGKLLSAGQALKKGWINRETTLRLLQAQESAGGILDPVLSVFLPKDVALDRKLIDEDLYRALNKRPTCYIDPTTQQNICYSDLKIKCRVEPASGLLLLPAPEKPMTVSGLRGEVPISALVDSNLLTASDVEKINEGTLTSKDIEDKLKTYLHGSSCIAGVYDEKNNRTLPIYQAMKEGLLRPGTTLELLEAQAASGFMIDPVNNLCLTVEQAWKRGLVGKEYKSKLLSAERAVTGYKDPRTGKIISLFQAIEKGVIEKGHGIRLLEAQIASGGIIDPKESHRIDVEIAYQRGYFDKEMNEILTYEGDDTKGFFDPNTQENLTYLQLKDRCIKDEKTGLVLLPLWDKSKPRATQQTSQKNTLRKRRVVIVDPDTGKEMTVREAYHRELIDYDTFLELSEQECEWEEITITAADGTTRVVIVDRKTGRQFDIQDALDKGVIEQSALESYQSGAITLTEFADQILSKTTTGLSLTSTNAEDVATCSSPTQMAPSSPTARRRFASISITLSPPSAVLDDQSPIAAVFDTETIEKITIPEAHRRGIMDTITAQRLLEAQVCTGGIINPANGERLYLQDAVRQGIVDEDMANKLKPAQKAYLGFEDVKTKRKMSAAEAMKEKWLPYDAGQRFLEFQYLTGGLIEPETGRKVSIEEAIRRGWLDGRGARKLQDTRNYAKNLTCPKTKLKISYKEAMDNCMVEENNGMKMIQATSISSKGISSPYNVSNPGSRSGSRAGSRTGSRSGSRRGSVDLTSSFSYSFSSTGFSSRSSS